MHIDKYEKYWIYAVSATLGVFMAALMVGAIVFGVRVPTPEGFVNPNRLNQTRFANPGVVDMGNGEYEVTMIAQMWNFVPNSIEVPEGSTVTFYITSRDVTHGFMIEHHNANVEVLPGHVASVRVDFDTAGEYRIICHEYCGQGHAAMHMAINVVAHDDVQTAMNGE